MYTRASPTNILARKSARVGQVGGQVGEDRRACPARGKLNGERLARAPRHGEDVRVGVGPMEFQLYYILIVNLTVGSRGVSKEFSCV